MKRFMLLAIAICLAIIAAVAQDFPAVSYDEVETSKRYIKGNIFQKDLLLYSYTLEVTHPHFADPKHAKVLRKITDELYKECAEIEDAKSFCSMLQRLISPLNDGHSQVATGRSQSEIFPIYILFDDKQSGYVYAIDKGQTQHLGKRIAAINSEPISEFLTEARMLVSGDNEVFKNIQLSKTLSLRDFWREYGFGGDTLSLTFTDGTSTAIGVVTPDKVAIEQLARQDYITTEPRNLPFHYEIVEEESICYLQFNMCYDSVTYPNLNHRFDDFIESMMADIEAESIKTLVIDVRNNGGGNSSLCDLLLSYLTDFDEMKQMGCKVRMSDLLLHHQPNLRNITLNGGGRPTKGEVFDFWQIKYDNPEMPMSAHRINRDASKVFKGNVVFISGMNTFSSAGMLLTLARDNNIGTIIGETSCHRPSHYGDVLRFKLPNTNTIATVSCRYITRPNSELDGETELVPDVIINLSDYNKPGDPAWEYIIENY